MWRAVPATFLHRYLFIGRSLSSAIVHRSAHRVDGVAVKLNSKSWCYKNALMQGMGAFLFGSAHLVQRAIACIGNAHGLTSNHCAILHKTLQCFSG